MLARLHLERLDDRRTPAAWPTDIRAVVAADAGQLPVLHLFDAAGTDTPLTAFDPAFRGGVRYATGDVTGDGRDDLVVAAGPGGGPHVKVYDGATGDVVRQFMAFDPAFRGGVEIAVGDVNRDGIGDIITGAGAGGGPHVRAFDAKTGRVLSEFFAFEPAFRGGVFVAAGDLNRDGIDDVIVGAGSTGGPRVIAWDPATGGQLVNFFPFEPGFRGGVRVAAADTTGDGVDEIVTAAGPTGGPRVRVFDVSRGVTVLDRFVADATNTGGVRLAAIDQNRDGRAEVVAQTTAAGVNTATVFSQNEPDWLYSVWAGDGPAPASYVGRANALPVVVGTPNPVRTLAGTVEAVAADGKSLTLRRGDGARILIDLDGDDPPPPGTVFIDTMQLPPADIVIGDRAGAVSDLPAGSWVAVRVARAWNPSADRLTALSVRRY